MGTHPIFESDFDCLTEFRIKMPRKNNRRFIKPGEGQKFKLMNRSIRDLGGYVDGAGQNVLAPIDENFEDMDAQERRALQREYGLDVDDNYNYMQHLRERSNEVTEWMSADTRSVFSVASGMSRASRASRMSRMSRMSRASKHQGKFFETDQELPEGHFQEIAAAQNEFMFDIDPDVAAQLEDGADDAEMIVNPGEDSGEDEECDLDIIINKANEECDDDIAYGTGENIGDMDRGFIMNRFIGEGELDSDVDERDERDAESSTDDETGPDIDPALLARFYRQDDEMDERKTQFTAYSMTSSIMRRSEKLENLDDQFEEMFITNYNEDEIGDLPHKNLDENEIDLDSEYLKQTMEDDYERFIPKAKNAIDFARGLNMGDLVPKEAEEESESDDADIEMVTVKPKPKWDCETICSTYSNLYNRPKILDDGFSIRSGKVRPKRGDRKVMFGSALKELESQYQEERSEMKLRPQARRKDETKEEKKARKAQVKEMKRERRIEKKETKSAFASEFRDIARRETGQSIKLN